MGSRVRRMQPDLARWLVRERNAIERNAGGLEPASAEAEALRRFRSFALVALSRGAAAPSLEGLRAPLRRTARALDAWIAAAVALAPPELKAQAALAPLRAQFAAALAASQPARRAAALATPSARRAVPAAIDRIADVFLAADADDGAIVDANPAACALLGLARPELLARELSSLAALGSHASVRELLDTVAEGREPPRTLLALLDASGAALRLDVRVTRYAAGGRSLVLLLGRSVAH
jgi:PAS domain S-box-containing protein